MKKTNIFALLVSMFVISSGLVSGCTIAKDVGEAQAVSDSYYSALSAKDYDKAITFFSDQFFEKTSKDDWKDSMSVIIKKLGDYKSSKLTGWNVNYSARVGGNVETYKLTYEVEYTKYSSAETFTIQRQGKDSPPLILGLNINSEGLLKD